MSQDLEKSAALAKRPDPQSGTQTDVEYLEYQLQQLELEYQQIDETRQTDVLIMSRDSNVDSLNQYERLVSQCRRSISEIDRLKQHFKWCEASIKNYFLDYRTMFEAEKAIYDQNIAAKSKIAEIDDILDYMDDICSQITKRYEENKKQAQDANSLYTPVGFQHESSEMSSYRKRIKIRRPKVSE